MDPLSQFDRLVYDGPMETRIQYGTDLELDREMSIFALVDSPRGREALSGLYHRDVEAARKHGVPIVINAPTYRASPAHLARMAYSVGDIVRVNKACVSLTEDVRQASAHRAKMLITAPVGPKYAGYHPDQDDTVEAMIAYHTPQAEALAGAGVDLVSVAAMPGAVDAIGAATAVARTGVPYTVGFIVTASGTLLDGTPLADLIARLDAALDPRPLFYVLGCTHPSVCATVLDRGGGALTRVRGVKANGSSLPPAELLALDRPMADPPDAFADALLALGRGRGFRIYGGCCGTDTDHVERIAARLAAGTGDG